MPGKAVRGGWPATPNDKTLYHDQHLEHFGQALQDALNKWPTEDADNVQVTFMADIRKNPGGVKEYIVMIGG